jgi:hypothetical protein
LTEAASFMDITKLRPLRNVWLSAVDNSAIIRECLPASPLLKLEQIITALKIPRV